MTARHAVAPGYLTLCLLLGGASAAGLLANLLLQLAALPLIGWALWSIRRDPPDRSGRTLLLLLAALTGLCLVQLIPLPPAVWTALPGRGWVATNYGLLGLPLPWLPLTLTPGRATASMLWLLPAVATLLAVVVLGAFRARWTAWAIVGVAGAGVVLGALQIVGGAGGAYLYEITNDGVAVGFFSNANHNATLLLSCIPLIAALQAHAKRRRSSSRNASAVTVLAAAGYAVVVVGLLTNLSLAGIGLCVPVALASFLAFGAPSKGKGKRGWVIGLGALVSVAAIAIIVWGPFGNNLIGEQKTNVELTRQTSVARTLHAATEYLPFGSGVGSFLSIYRTQEPVGEVGTTYMNHAHSDWAELLLETGLVGMALAGLFLFWWTRRAIAIWREDEVDLFARAAVIVTATMMVHSLVDYPLRTAALSAVFAACLGLMTGARPAVARRAKLPAPTRHLSI